MRKSAVFLTAILSCSMIGDESSAQLLVMYESKADDFMRAILEHHTGIDSCSNEFDPFLALEGIDVRTENFKHWSERDPLTPGGANHMMQWDFSGVRILALTFFGSYGPSTWLSRLDLSNSSVRLDGRLKIGESIDRFAESLELSERMKATGRLVSSRGDMTIHTEGAGIVSRVTIECVAD